MFNRLRTELKRSKQSGARTPASPSKAAIQSSLRLPFGADRVVERTLFDGRSSKPCDLLRFQQILGNRFVQRMLTTRFLQAKLRVGAAHDPHEEEADRVAEQVVGLGKQELKKTKADIYAMRRKSLMQHENTLNDKGEQATNPAIAQSFHTSSGFQSRLNVARHRGTPLPESVRKFMEPRFGADFSGVRLHTGSDSAQLNREVGAQAFTLGQDIYLGADKIDLDSMAGKRLLAHELAHTIQQGAGMFGLTPLQRRVKPYKDDTGKEDMSKLADSLSTCVDLAKSIVDGNPLLKGVEKRDEGYLKTWVKTFDEFTSTGELPSFFYARYGYAIESLATKLFMAKDHKGYKVDAQVTYGGTRPDFVIRKGATDVAWLDITSSGSKEHIYDKQGGGWKTRPYVAEILYNMPDPAAFAQTAKGSLSPQQLKALKEADQTRARRELEFDKGMRAMSLILGEAYAAAYTKKGEGLSKKDVKETTVEVCQEHLGKFLDKDLTSRFAAGVLASIESIEVAGQIDTGLSWANWAFGSGGDRATGRALLWEFGKE